MQGVSRTRRLTAVIGLCLVGVATQGSACDTAPDASKKDADVRNKGVAGLIASQPAKTMAYSPTRATINRWIETWDSPKKLAYVYLQNGQGDLIGYYVFEGLPVSYCASITRTYDLIDTPDDGSTRKNQMVPAPGVDGAWYGGAGSCNTFYGYDAGARSYMQFTAGLGINPLIYERPLPRQDVKALGFTTIEEAKKLR